MSKNFSDSISLKLDMLVDTNEELNLCSFWIKSAQQESRTPDLAPAEQINNIKMEFWKFFT